MLESLQTNTTISHYRIVKKIGAGGMGEVYLAEDTELERQVALKVLLSEVAADDDRLRRFVQEAKAASALNHPNILTVYEIGTFENSRFIATELIKGETLRQRLQGEPLSLREALDVAAQIASALNAAHSAGIVHRDIKPENVMLRDDGFVKVLDFGLAKLTEKKTENLDSEGETRALVNTSPGLVMGTVSYMSPEQARGKAVDARSDVWSLGVVLYEMLRRRTPFAEETVSDTIAAILKSEAAPLPAETPAELQRIVRKALQKNRDERYQTIKDFLLDVKNLKRELEFAEELERSQIPHRAQASNVGTSGAGENATAILPTAVSTQNSLPQRTSSAEYIAGEVKKHKLGVALASLIALALIGVGIWFFFLRTSTANAPIDSIAVLPFENRSGNADSEYLSDGLAESLIYRLSQLTNLKVSPTSSVMRYKGKETDVRKIAGQLGVNTVMTGRMVQRGDDLIISVELIDVRNNKLLWGEQYERKTSELLQTQREMATTITEKLQLKLAGADTKGITKKYTDSNEAYQLYLKGRYHYAKRTKDNLHTLGIEYYEQAIRLDSNFALAYVGIANSYAIMPSYAFLSQQVAIPKSKAAAQKALEIDPTLAEAHSALAYSAAVYEWDWAAAERAYLRALELNPNVAEIHYRYAMHYLIPVGRVEEAIAEINRALEIDPLSLAMSANLAAALMHARQFERALEQAEKTYQLDFSHPTAHIWLVNIYNIRGMYGEAIKHSEKVLRKNPTDQYFLWLAGYAYAKSGRRNDALEVIKKFQTIAKTDYVEPYNVALVYTALGDKDKAFAELEKGFAERDWSMPFLKVDPFFDPLRDDARFKDLLRRMNLPE